MPESRIAQLATSPLLKDFAAGAGQNAIRKVGNFIAPLCMVPDLTFRYKVYTEQNRYRMPDTTRQPGSPATMLGFGASDATMQLQPNALDFPIGYAEQLSEEGLSYSIQEGQVVLADASALVLEYQILTMAQAAAIASPLSQAADFTEAMRQTVIPSDQRLQSTLRTAAPARARRSAAMEQDEQPQSGIERTSAIQASAAMDAGAAHKRGNLDAPETPIAGAFEAPLIEA